MLVCESVDEVVRAVGLARERGVPWVLLGGGCNVLVADAGVRGLVIVNKAAGIEFTGTDVRAEAGASLALLARETVERGLAGLEWAAGLPGTVGGAVVGNAGAFDGDIAGVLSSATVLEPDGTITERPNEWFEFGYRESRLKRGHGEMETRGRGDAGHATRNTQHVVVLAATFGLKPGDPQALAARAAEILEWRRTKHPSGATMAQRSRTPLAATRAI